MCKFYGDACLPETSFESGFPHLKLRSLEVEEEAEAYLSRRANGRTRAQLMLFPAAPALRRRCCFGLEVGGRCRRCRLAICLTPRPPAPTSQRRLSRPIALSRVPVAAVSSVGGYHCRVLMKRHIAKIFISLLKDGNATCRT